MDSKINIALIGCGKMGSAMLHGWLASDMADHLCVLDPQGLPEDFKSHEGKSLSYFKSTSEFVEHSKNAGIFVLAVKPQIMDTACKSITNAVNDKALVLSIAAGRTITSFENIFGATQPIVRAMPNTPAAIGKGITIACANKTVTDSQKDLVTQILKSVGKVGWVNDESMLDPVTAVSGSGPAYVFLLIEAMAKAGQAAGLDADFAMKLARETVIGSAALAETEHDTPAAQLRENVTSPGGTTAAALDVLMNGEFQDVLNRAIAAASARSKELSS